jgi:hypothetical protein
MPGVCPTPSQVSEVADVGAGKDGAGYWKPSQISSMIQNYFFFFEEGEGYVKALEKSTSPSPSMREVFELYAQDD